MRKAILGAVASTFASIIVMGTVVFAAPQTMTDGQVFDPTYYAQTYPDVVAAFGMDPNALYAHYKNYGAKEGRLPYAGATISSRDSNIPIGLLLSGATRDAVIQTMGTPDKTTTSGISYDGFETYGYKTTVEMRFTDGGELQEVYFRGDHVYNTISYTSADARRVADLLTATLGVKPKEGHHEGLQFKFQKDGVQYFTDTYSHRWGSYKNGIRTHEEYNYFNLKVTKL